MLSCTCLVVFVIKMLVKIGAEVDQTNQKLAEAAKSVFEAADVEALKSGAFDAAKAKAIDLRKTTHESEVSAESSQKIKLIDAAPSNPIFYLTFDRIKVEINGVPFNVGCSNDEYKGYFDTLQNYARGLKKRFFENCCG